MSVKKKVRTNQPEKNVQFELSQRERLMVLMFRQLNHQSQADIIRFLDVLLTV
ncbi:hypothetical protein HFV04_017055 [Pseudomonas sp. BIGb0427]|uniref:hypothetical protein n=1 Tax=Pseudomonas sp. BIGb0427 TaxID=2724470 RepID=UPI0018A725CD|nr:hypothetical protein [Pseudomonas sp. BIGb0427]QPG61227.1 hypothetical protein HFV04_017055 [Pseudomonas sp. BIGb0427]